MAASNGSMRHEVTVKNFTRSSDGAGGFVNNTTTTTTIFCAVRQVSQQETYNQGRLDGKSTFEFITRFTTAVEQKSVLEYDSKSFNVRSVTNTNERDKYIVIIAEEGVAL